MCQSTNHAWKCIIIIINNDDYRGGNVEPHQPHIEFSQTSGVDLAKFNQQIGLELDDEESQKWIESPGHLGRCAPRTTGRTWERRYGGGLQRTPRHTSWPPLGGPALPQDWLATGCRVRSSLGLVGRQRDRNYIVRPARLALKRGAGAVLADSQLQVREVVVIATKIDVMYRLPRRQWSPERLGHH